jgi:hypothetical protein
VRRIWANKKLVYDASADNTGPNKDPAIGSVRFYLGTEDQEVDPLIEATDGPSPAYLGYAYVVFEDFELTEYANRPPQLEFEVVTVGEASLEPPKLLGEGGVTHLYTNPSTGEQTLWSVNGSSVYVYSLPDEALIQTIALPSAGTSITSITGEVWIGHWNPGGTNAINATPINPVTYEIGASGSAPWWRTASRFTLSPMAASAQARGSIRPMCRPRSSFPIRCRSRSKCPRCSRRRSPATVTGWSSPILPPTGRMRRSVMPIGAALRRGITWHSIRTAIACIGPA